MRSVSMLNGEAEVTEKSTEKYWPSPGEEAVAAYIAGHNEAELEQHIAEDRREEVFYHLSPMRQAVLAWYPFQKDWHVLEVGAQMGAVTGWLCGACAEVTAVEPNDFYRAVLEQRHQNQSNLAVLAVPPEAKRFDAVVLICPGSLAAADIHRWKELLAPEGRLLLAVPNRFGLKYWCGQKSAAAALPFDDVAGYSGLMTRAELAQALAQAGFGENELKWYYPMPDHLFCQEIYSAEYPPTPEGKGRFYPRTGGAQGCVLNENRLRRDVLAGGGFPFFANAFFVEARNTGQTAACPAEYAALTMGRPPEGRLATVLYAQAAEKRPLHPRAGAGLARLAENQWVLAARGIPVVPLEWDGTVLNMPRVRREPLTNQWNRESEAGTFSRERLFRQMDAIVECIHLSSEWLPAGSGGWDRSFGPVQKTAFPELVPANCFWDEERGEPLFFDQEFIRENCPESVVLYRAVACVGFSPAAAVYGEELKARYGLTEIWQALQEEETRFLNHIFGRQTSDPLAEEMHLGQTIAQNRFALAEKDIVARLRARGWRSVAIYGYGQQGKALCAMLLQNDFGVDYILDQRAEQYTESAVPVIKPEHLPNIQVDGMLISLARGGHSVAQELAEKADFPVLTLQEL